MSAKKAVVLYVHRKHVSHAQLIKQLESLSMVVEEHQLPDENAGSCSVASDLKKYVDSELIIIYVSKQVLENVCISSVTQLAERNGVRLVCIWLDEEVAIEVSGSIAELADALTVFSEDMADIFSGEKSAWDGPDGKALPKRKIKRYTCG
ncbi:hypothetical protein [Xanthomonas sp. SHU 199]|uniref:hypothetical protein n=1 Tax=Xanthomonas sp. SHU 199 TaxID=1591174 RepID=UPI0012FF21F7|nr:hypothetical protein [Xanthomonas sp. SHU 199]